MQGVILTQLSQIKQAELRGFDQRVARNETKGAAPPYQTQYFNGLNITKSNEMLDTIARFDAASLGTQQLRQRSVG